MFCKTMHVRHSKARSQKACENWQKTSFPLVRKDLENPTILGEIGTKQSTRSNMGSELTFESVLKVEYGGRVGMVLNSYPTQRDASFHANAFPFLLDPLDARERRAKIVTSSRRWSGLAFCVKTDENGRRNARAGRNKPGRQKDPVSRQEAASSQSSYPV